MILCVFSEFRTECVAKIANPAEITVRFQNKKSGIFTIRGVSGITLKVVNFFNTNLRKSRSCKTGLPIARYHGGTLSGAPPRLLRGASPGSRTDAHSIPCQNNAKQLALSKFGFNGWVVRAVQLQIGKIFLLLFPEFVLYISSYVNDVLGP